MVGSKITYILLLCVVGALIMMPSSFGAGVAEGGAATAEVNETSTSPVSREELEELIRIKSEELQNVNRELETTQGNLEGVRREQTTLQRELRILRETVSQLELNIRADELASEKLEFEIDSLNYDIRDITITIEDKREVITHILRELQQQDQVSLLALLLENASLADSFFELQALKNLKLQLRADITALTNLHGELRGKAETADAKQASLTLHKRNLAARKLIAKDKEEERKTVLAQTKNKESLYEQQLEELKEQQDTIAEAISKIEEQLRANFDVSILPVRRPGVFAWPLALVADGGKGRITQHFGEVSYLYRGKPHNGLDIGAPVGTPVTAADDGVVLAVDNNDRSRWNKYQYGKYVLLRHPNNLATLYAHLSQQVVTKRQEVKRGELIGYSGSTGYATGPHLHFGAYWAPSILMKSVPPAAGLVPVGVLVNPEDYL